jgi:bifunctional non-homologous end joining protein LigD
VKQFDVSNKLRVIKVPSSRDAAKSYSVSFSPSGKVWCNCKGFVFRRKCRHLKIAEQLRNPKPVTISDDLIRRATISSLPLKRRADLMPIRFVEPMLALPLPANFKPTNHVAEEKFDGHRIQVWVMSDKTVEARSRNGLVRTLPPQLVQAFAKLPAGVYDGELIVAKAGRSYDVVNKARAKELRFVVFDVLHLMGETTLDIAYKHRRALLEPIFRNQRSPFVTLADSIPVRNRKDLQVILKMIWRRDGEGVIIKDRDARYHPGKRTTAFLKVKALKTAVLEVTGFKPSKGKKQNRGPFAIALLRDSKGNETSAKVLNDETLAELELVWREHVRKPAFGKKARAEQEVHPYVGRKLCIEYQERTPSGSYRHVRWDRWEDE